MKKSVSIFIMLTTLSGCIRPVNEGEKIEWMRKVNTEEVSRLVISYSNELKHTRHLYLEDASVIFHENLEKLRVSYITQEILEMDQARELLVEVTEGILSRINAHPLLSQELAYFPLRAEDLRISIICESFHAEYLDSKYINWILLEEGEVFYYDASLQNPSTDVINVRREPYFKSFQFSTFGKEAEILWGEEHPSKQKFQQLLKSEVKAPPKG